MAFYVDGFVIPVPRSKVADYKTLARKVGKIFIEHGAVEIVEAAGEDVPPGKLTSFPKAVQLKSSEVAFFSWITYHSRKHRDKVNAKVLVDPRMAKIMLGRKHPFDAKRMIFGGFKPVVHLRSK
jgi:uncharacterized protein YbaA (DUF1428 family)